MCQRPLNKALIILKMEESESRAASLSKTIVQMQDMIKASEDELNVEIAIGDQWAKMLKVLPEVKNEDCIGCPLLKYNGNDGICHNRRSNYHRLRVMSGPDPVVDMYAKPCVY